jgi:hypothetical protein
MRVAVEMDDVFATHRLDVPSLCKCIAELWRSRHALETLELLEYRISTPLRNNSVATVCLTVAWRARARTNAPC